MGHKENIKTEVNSKFEKFSSFEATLGILQDKCRTFNVEKNKINNKINNIENHLCKKILNKLKKNEEKVILELNLLKETSKKKFDQCIMKYDLTGKFNERVRIA